MLHRFPTGVDGEKVHQKRLPARRAAVGARRSRLLPALRPHADELCVTELASVIWAVQMSTVEFHPWNSRRADTEQPDEWRIDLDPMPDCGFDTRAAGRARRPRGARRARRGRAGRRPRAATGCTSTCGSSRDYGFADVRRAALAFAREVERRAPDDVTTTWWRKDRDPAAGVRRLQPERPGPHDRRAYSVRGRPDGDGVDADHAGTRSTTSSPQDFTIAHGARRASPSSATCTPASTTPCSRSTRCSSGPTATSARVRAIRAAGSDACDRHRSRSRADR